MSLREVPAFGYKAMQQYLDTVGRLLEGFGRLCKDPLLTIEPSSMHMTLNSRYTDKSPFVSFF